MLNVFEKWGNVVPKYPGYSLLLAGSQFYWFVRFFFITISFSSDSTIKHLPSFRNCLLLLPISPLIQMLLFMFPQVFIFIHCNSWPLCCKLFALTCLDVTCQSIFDTIFDPIASLVKNENATLPFADAFYFTWVTLSTIGYGDYYQVAFPHF